MRFVCVILAVTLLIFLTVPVTAHAQEPVIIKRCLAGSGRCEFTIQHAQAVVYAGVLWHINGVQQTPKIVEAAKPFVHYFQVPGDYEITAVVFYYETAPVKVSTFFTVLPLGNPVERAAETAKNFVVNYALPFIAAVVFLLNALGVRFV